MQIIDTSFHKPFVACQTEQDHSPLCLRRSIQFNLPFGHFRIIGQYPHIILAFGMANGTGLPVAKPTPTEPQPSFRQRVNSVVSGFYESLDNIFKNFTLTAESGLNQLKTEPIGGGTAKGE